MKVLLTGGAGFIGSHVADQIVSHGYDLAIIDNLTSGSAAHIPKNIPLYQLDINDPYVEKIFELKKPEILIHLAAQTSVVFSMHEPYCDFQTNTEATVKLLQYAVKHGVKQVIFASSAAVYGEPLRLPVDEEQPCDPQSFYAVSKYAAERYIINFSRHHNLETTILRFSNVYGPRQNPSGEAGVVSQFLSKLVKQESGTIYGGSQTRDFIYVKDVAAACLKTIQAGEGGIYNVSSQTELSVRDLYGLMARKLGVNMPAAFRNYRKGELKRSVLSNQKAWKVFSWRPAYSIAEGLDETIDAYRKSCEFGMEGRWHGTYSTDYTETTG
ncbi:UDP-glucose 4-epimerase [Sporosarcina luteola]|nr:UDP-glucose 4-epimerase [Sporosarcina luteola]